jgi:protein-S-isoprenylcysteine O-methyltransferase Ste14
MRMILAVIVSAVAIAVLIDSPRRELVAQLDRQWQEYREHVGNPAFPATSENLSDSFQIRLDTKR